MEGISYGLGKWLERIEWKVDRIMDEIGVTQDMLKETEEKETSEVIQRIDNEFEE